MASELVEYTREDITRALTVLAFCNGRPGHAERVLKDMGANCPTKQTLHAWKTRHADIYEDAVSRLDQEVIPQLDEMVRSQVVFQKLATDRLIENVDELELKDLSNAARNASVSMSIGIQNSQLLKGQPTQRVEVTDAARVLHELNEIARQANGNAIVDSTAEEEDNDG